jgi:hypothetical protein
MRFRVRGAKPEAGIHVRFMNRATLYGFASGPSPRYPGGCTAVIATILDGAVGRDHGALRHFRCDSQETYFLKPVPLNTPLTVEAASRSTNRGSKDG